MSRGDEEAKKPGANGTLSTRTAHMWVMTVLPLNSSPQPAYNGAISAPSLTRPIWNPLVADGILGFDSNSEGVQEDDGTCCMGVRSQASGTLHMCCP